MVTLVEVSEREEGIVDLHLPIGPLKTSSGFELVPRCEPTSPLADDIATAPSGPVTMADL